MRSAGWILLALVAGFLLGGIQPRREVAGIQDEIDELREALEDAEDRASRSSRTQIFNIPGVGDFDFDDGDEGDDEGSFNDRDDREGATAGSPGGDDDEPTDDDGPRDRPTAQDLPSDELDIAVEGQRLRAAQSRAALIESLELSSDEIDEFDTIMTDMNDRIADIADDAAYIMLSGEEPSPSELLGMTHDATGILYDAQQDLEDLVGTESLDSLDETTSAAWNYIDLGPLRDATLDLATDME